MTTITETTDATETSATAYAMSSGDVFLGQLDGDSGDWVAVTLVAGQTYSFGAVGIGAAASGLIDPALTLHLANGDVAASNNNGGPGKTAVLTFTATTSGTYYIETHANGGADAVDYGLAMSHGAHVSYGVELGAAIVYRPGVGWADTAATPVTVTWGLRDQGPAHDAQGNLVPFHQLTSAQAAAGQIALENYSEVGGITFQQVNPGGTTNHATILMGAYTSTKDGAGAFAYYPGGAGDNANAGDLWLNNDSVSKTDLPFGSYDQFVLLHELGHAMGLAHPGDYNAAPGVSITYHNSAQFVEDSQQFSVMSYFAATDTEAFCPDSYPDTLMLFDIYAIQQLYGINFDSRAGDSVYGFHTNVGGAYDFTTNTDPLLCIWDGAGIDTLNLSGFDQDQMIDLNAGHFSDVGGFKGNLSIALGASIENAVGGSGIDVILGTAIRNILKGGIGADDLSGNGGNDKLVGGAQGDHISGGLGNDVMVGGGGKDSFEFHTGTGHDRITDFDIHQDMLLLDDALWGNAALSAAQVVSTYASTVPGGDVVFDFGAEHITLTGLTTLTGLAAALTII